MAIRGRGRPRKAIVAHKSPQFFKVFIPDHSSLQLRVPPAFTKYFNRSIPNKVILKDDSEKIWSMEMEQVENNLVIKNGWQSFVNYHSLVLGDFLVFRFDRKSMFDVTIYGTNGCMKEHVLPVDNTACAPVKIKKEQIICRTKRKFSEISENKFEKSRGRPRRREIAAADCNVKDRPEFLPSKYPYFVASINPSKPTVLNVSRRFLTKHEIEMRPEMLLRDEKQKKSWPVGITFTSDSRVMFTKGWLRFCKDNALGFDDRCVLEFAGARGRRSGRIIHVHLIRARERKKTLNLCGSNTKRSHLKVKQEG